MRQNRSIARAFRPQGKPSPEFLHAVNVYELRSVVGLDVLLGGISAVSSVSSSWLGGLFESHSGIRKQKPQSNEERTCCRMRPTFFTTAKGNYDDDPISNHAA
jgi:hypothetical protein